MTATVAKAPVGRPKNPRDLAERTELIRVASLAASVLVSLRQSGRGEYSSERMLRQFLSDDNVSFTSADLAPALGLLEAVGKIGRGLDKGNNSPRSGWLVSDSQRPVHTSVSPAVSEAVESVPEPAGDITEATEHDPVDVLADAVVRALFAGNGRSNRCDTRVELEARLVADGASYDRHGLDLAVARLTDCGRVLRPVERLNPNGLTPNSERPYVLDGSHVYDRVDRLAAEVVEFLRKSDHGERFDTEEQLAGWLRDAGVMFDADDLPRAVLRLEFSRILLRPQPDHPFDPSPWVLR